MQLGKTQGAMAPSGSWQEKVGKNLLRGKRVWYS